MSTNLRRQDDTPPPPPLDEGYWSSLLTEGEFARSVLPNHEAQTEDGSSSNQFKVFGDDDTIPHHRGVDKDWVVINQVMYDDEVVEATVIGYNRGGLLVEWQSLRGFVPASQLVDFPVNTSSSHRRSALVDRVGSQLVLRVIELIQEQNRLIFSERAAQVEPGERANILESLQPGDVIEGQVTNLCDFGAFVDLGGLEGLIHISELSWGRVGHPADMLERGQEVEAYVLDINKNAGRIALSLKRLRPDPWQTVETRYQIGQLVEGTITNVVDFGAFACIEEGLEGLIHVSELAEGHFLHPRNVVSEGQAVRARILSIDGRSRRLGLSLRSTT